MTTQTISTPVDPITRRAVILTLTFAFLGTTFDGVELNLISYPLPYIASSLRVDTTAIVAIITAQGLASLVGGFAFGWLSDVIGRRRSFAACVFLYGLGTLLAALVPNYETFFGTRIIAGLGIGGEFGIAFAMFAEVWQSRRRGLMGGCIEAMFPFGQIITQAILYVTLSSAGDNVGWRLGFFILGGASILIAIGGFIWIPESTKWLQYQELLRNNAVPDELRRAKVPYVDLVRRGLAGGTIAFVLLATAMFMYSYSLGTYTSTFLLTIAGATLPVATAILFIGLVVELGVQVLFGALSDFLGRKWAFALGTFIGVIGIAFYTVLVITGKTSVSSSFLSSPMFWAITICMGGYGGLGILGVWMSEFFPTRVRSTGSNVSYYAGRGLGAGVYPLFALRLAGGSVAYALALGSIGAVGALVVSVLSPDRTGREIKSLE